MNLLWPGFLVLLALVPISVAVYLWMLRRQRTGLRYSSLSLLRAAVPKYSQWRRHLPFAIFLLAFSGLVLALARPINIVTVPTGTATIILTLDVSRSMLQNDIQPNRLRAAQAAALQFIESQKAGTQIGLVAFAGYAQMVQAPTTDRDALRTAIRSLTTGRGTAIGSGILQSIDAIAEIDPSVAPSTNEWEEGTAPPPVPKGAYVPHIIVLLTDGVATTGPIPTDAAQQAVDRGVRVYTIGFGTEMGSDQFGGPGGFGSGGSDPGLGQQPGGGPGFGGGRFRRGIDEETLKEIAAVTDGEYYEASSAGELTKVFQGLPTYLIAKHEVMEISVFFAGLGALLMALALFLSFRLQPLS
jgi:Ca-activated chloride channel homolog